MKSLRLPAALGAAILLTSLSHSFAGSPEAKMIEPATESEWKFRIEPYGWATGIDGTAGVAGIKMGVDTPFSKVLENLDMAAALQLEARNGRWGVLLDGFYADISAGGNPPGPLYSNATAEMKQVIAEVALAYRIVEGEKGFVDLLVGGRYNYLQLDISTVVDGAGVQKVSEDLSERIVDAVSARVQSRVEARLAEFRAALPAAKAQIEAQIRSGAQAEADGTVARDLAKEAVKFRHLFPSRLARHEIEQIVDSVAKQRVALAEASAEEQVAALRAAVDGKKAAALSRAQAAVAKAEKKLAKAINRELRERLPEGGSASKGWMDPFIGFRAQYNFTEKFFLAGRADIGGFGVSSDLTWQAQATLGYNFNENVFTELGYRYLETDYTDGGFTYDIAQSGVFAGLGFRF